MRAVAEHLVREGLSLYNRRIAVCFYDDILTQEYDQYLEYLKNEEELKIYKNKMMNVAHGDTKDYEELSAMNGISEDMLQSSW